MNFEPLAVILQ